MAHLNNVEYDIITVLQSKLEAHEAYTKYIKDCQQAGNEECRTLFERISQDDQRHADELRTQLQRLLGQSTTGIPAQTGQDWANRQQA
jgi:bacterioferritin (cytochrome b1)